VKKVLRVVAVVEAASFLLLLAATGIKHTTGPEGGVKVLGPVHGLLFVAYVILALAVASAEEWRVRRLLLVLLCAVVPFGGFFADRRLIDEPAPSTSAA